MNSKNYQVVILPEAEKDITEILDYISGTLHNLTAAKKLWQDIKDGVSRVAMYPYAMSLIKNQNITLGKEYRRIEINNYTMVYKINEEQKEIRIFAVLYAPSNIMNKVMNRI